MRLILLTILLMLHGCASTIHAPSKLLETSGTLQGHGVVVGSILLSVPTEISDQRMKKHYDALRGERYRAIARRYVVHPSILGISRVEYLGDKYEIDFEPGIERHFAISAPEGTYSILDVWPNTNVVSLQKRLCIQFPAGFRVDSGKITYIGQLTITPSFTSHDVMKMMPDIVVGAVMTSVSDNKGETMNFVGMSNSDRTIGIDTHLMRAAGKLLINCRPNY